MRKLVFLLSVIFLLFHASAYPWGKSSNKKVGLLKNLRFLICPVKMMDKENINNYVLSLMPWIYDPQKDTTIVSFEFWQDTTTGKIYEEKIFASLHGGDRIKFSNGTDDWPIAGLGMIGDFRTDKKHISVIIKSYHIDGSVKTQLYKEKIRKLTFRSYHDSLFRWAMYSIDVEICDDEEEIYGG